MGASPQLLKRSAGCRQEARARWHTSLFLFCNKCFLILQHWRSLRCHKHVFMLRQSLPSVATHLAGRCKKRFLPCNKHFPTLQHISPCAATKPLEGCNTALPTLQLRLLVRCNNHSRTSPPWRSIRCHEALRPCNRRPWNIKTVLSWDWNMHAARRHKANRDVNDLSAINSGNGWCGSPARSRCNALALGPASRAATEALAPFSQSGGEHCWSRRRIARAHSGLLLRDLPCWRRASRRALPSWPWPP